MSKYKVGDRVRILHTDYIDCGLDVGTIHEVKYVNSCGIDLLGIGPENKDDPLYFTHWEVEPAPPSSFEIGKTYKTREHGEYTCIHVADNGKAWLAFDDSPAYVWDDDGKSISLTPEWDVVWEPVTETVSEDVEIAGRNVTIEYTLVDGVADMGTVKVR